MNERRNGAGRRKDDHAYLRCQARVEIAGVRRELALLQIEHDKDKLTSREELARMVETLERKIDENRAERNVQVEGVRTTITRQVDEMQKQVMGMWRKVIGLLFGIIGTVIAVGLIDKLIK